jgi:L-fuconolactonase
MPDFPIIDAHMHLWDPAQFRISWLDGNPLLNQRYTLPEYRAQTSGIAIEAMVYVEVDIDPHYGLLEARWAAEQALADPRIQGIVATAPLEHGERARPYLEALIATSPILKGVRRLIQAEAETFCLQPDFIRGVQILSEYGLSFDICINHRQFNSLLEMVRHCPNTAFVLDHCAKPDIKNGVLDPWREQMHTLASFPNVFCKVSGLVTEAVPHQWTVEDLEPYLSQVLAVFGEDRVIFGGDWPVVLTAASYQRWVEALDTLTAHLSPQAKRKLWAENARRFYRLTVGS